VEAVLLRNVKTGELQTVPVDGVFVFIGHDPNSDLAKGFVTLDAKGYIVTDVSLAASVPGVFAAGEVRQGAVRQLVSACGEGCAAALAAQAFLDDHR
jgi:thioredoxin reductase (NADPH)